MYLDAPHLSGGNLSAGNVPKHYHFSPVRYPRPAYRHSAHVVQFALFLFSQYNRYRTQQCSSRSFPVYMYILASCFYAYSFIYKDSPLVYLAAFSSIISDVRQRLH